MRFRDNQLFTVFLPALRDLKNTRRPPAGERRVFYVPSTDGVRLFCTLIGDDPDACAIVAHPAIGGSYHPQVRLMAEELARSFSVLVFDFRGHGRSTGVCRMGFRGPSEDLEAVARRARELGFGKLGLVGFSLGAAAGFLLEARSPSFDAFVSVGCPPGLPDLTPGRGKRTVSLLLLRALGMRMRFVPDGGPMPSEVAPHLPAIPKLLAFGEWETAPAEDIERFAGSVAPPAEKLIVPGVWHADLDGREPMVREWLKRAL